MIAKLEVFKNPFLGPAMHALGIYKLDTENLKQALKDLKKVESDVINKGIIPWICPEGMRTKTLKPLKKGAFKMALNTNAIIIPMCIHNVYELLNHPISFNQDILRQAIIGKSIKKAHLHGLY